MSIPVYAQSNNIYRSFCKRLYDNVGSSYRNLVNYMAERWNPSGKTVWAEVDLVQGIAGIYRKPFVMQVSVYSRPDEDRFGHQLRDFVDAVKDAMNVATVSIYNFADPSSPVDTNYDFYPVLRPDRATSDLIGGNIKGRALIYDCHLYRPGFIFP